MATEVAIFQLKPGKSPQDANSSAGQVLKDTLNTLTEQKGFQQAYWGTEAENPSSFRLFVDWDAVEDHNNFIASETYKPFLDHFGEIANLKSASIVHVHFKPHPASKALSDHVSPVTEIRTTYFSSDISESDQNDFAGTFKQQVNKLNDSTDKATAAANGGWAVEEATIPGTSHKGKVYVGLIGWNSMEDHTSWTSSSDAKEVEKLAEKFAKHIKHVDNVHFSGTQIDAGPGGVGDISGGASTSVQEEILNPHDESKKPPKMRSDGTTTKNNPDLKGAANALHKERQGR